MLNKLLNRITEDEIKEINKIIEEFFFVEFTISELYQDRQDKPNIMKYKRLEKYIRANYEQVDCGCDETRFKKEV